MMENNNDSLSDFTIVIDSSLEDICNEWQQKLESIDLESVNVESIFSSLIDCGVLTSYIPSLDVAIKQVTSLVRSIDSLVENMVLEQFNIDLNNDDDKKNAQKKFDNYQLNNKNDSSVVNDSNTSIDGIITEDSTVDNSNLNLEINKEVLSAINSLDFQEFGLLMKCLANIAQNGTSLNTYLDNTEYADDLKKMLLENVNVPSTIKEVISEMDSKALQQTLRQFFLEDYSFSDTSKEILCEQVQKVADFKGITTDKLLSTDNVVDLLNDVKNISGNIDKVALSDDVQGNLLSIYDGNNLADMDENSIDVMRKVIEKIAERKNLNSEELLTNSANKSYVESEMSDVSRAYSFFKTLGAMDKSFFSETMKGVLS